MQATGLQLYKKETLTQVFSCEICKNFKSTYFEFSLPTATSVFAEILVTSFREFINQALLTFLPFLKASLQSGISEINSKERLDCWSLANLTLLTNLFPIHPFCTLWKQKTIRLLTQMVQHYNIISITKLDLFVCLKGGSYSVNIQPELNSYLPVLLYKLTLNLQLRAGLIFLEDIESWPTWHGFNAKNFPKMTVM